MCRHETSKRQRHELAGARANTEIIGRTCWYDGFFLPSPFNSDGRCEGTIVARMSSAVLLAAEWKLLDYPFDVAPNRETELTLAAGHY